MLYEPSTGFFGTCITRAPASSTIAEGGISSKCLSSPPPRAGALNP